jgi:hypothetical protein
MLLFPLLEPSPNISIPIVHCPTVPYFIIFLLVLFFMDCTLCTEDHLHTVHMLCSTVRTSEVQILSDRGGQSC